MTPEKPQRPKPNKNMNSYINDPNSLNRGPDEMSYADHIMSLRTDFFMALEEKKMGFHKKKLFTKDETRCLQSKINLKFPMQDMLLEKRKEKMQIKEGVIQEFDKRYGEMCNQEYQIKKNRNVSSDSPFDKKNSPPRQYLEVDSKLAKSPNKVRPADQGQATDVPLAGKLSDLGQQILSLGCKKA